MKNVVFALMIVLAVSSVAFADVSLGYVENDSPGDGLRSYTVRATGIGLMTLSEFTIQGNVNQEFSETGAQSPWLDDDTADPLDTGRDSYIAFGELRMPMDDNLMATTETVLNGSYLGPGTLNNCDAVRGHDAYMYLGAPSGELETRDLFHLVLEAGDSVAIALILYTVENYDPNVSEWNAEYIIENQIEYNFSGSNCLAVPEPGCIVMLMAAGMCLCGYWLRKKLR